MESISIEFPKVHPSLTKNGRRRSHWRTQRKATEEMRDDANFLIIKEMLKAEMGNEVAIMGKTTGPWTLGYHTLGVENFFPHEQRINLLVPFAYEFRQKPAYVLF